MPSYLYILHSKSGNRYYTGVSDHPEIRLQHHNSTETGFAARYRLWEIVFLKEYLTTEEAKASEQKIKSWKSKVMIQRRIYDILPWPGGRTQTPTSQ